VGHNSGVGGFQEFSLDKRVFWGITPIGVQNLGKIPQEGKRISRPHTKNFFAPRKGVLRGGDNIYYVDQGDEDRDSLGPIRLLEQTRLRKGATPIFESAGGAQLFCADKAT